MAKLTFPTCALIAGLAAASQAQAEWFVWLDYWWLKDCAKSSCMKWHLDAEPERRLACEGRDLDINEFSAKLETQFTVNPLCHGVTFVTYNGPQQSNHAAANRYNEPHWTLIIDYIPGRESQEWSLIDSGHNPLRDFESVGAPKEIAREVCSAITGQGESILR